jgi:hypothetical protein
MPGIGGAEWIALTLTTLSCRIQPLTLSKDSCASSLNSCTTLLYHFKNHRAVFNDHRAVFNDYKTMFNEYEAMQGNYRAVIKIAQLSEAVTSFA